jgi:ABC-type cobalamin transport system permease subunit
MGTGNKGSYARSSATAPAESGSWFGKAFKGSVGGAVIGLIVAFFLFRDTQGAEAEGNFKVCAIVGALIGFFLAVKHGR